MTALLRMPVVPYPAGPVPHHEQQEPDGPHVLVMPVPLQEGKPAGRIDRKQPKSGPFRPRTMTKHELADWYGVNRKTFVNAYLPPVMKKLLKKGYRPSCKLLSLAMVNIIVAHHDWPGD